MSLITENILIHFKCYIILTETNQITVYMLMYKTLGMSEISKGSSYGAANTKKDK